MPSTLAVAPGGNPVTVEIQPGATELMSLSLPAGKAATVTFREEEQTASVRWTDASGKVHTPRTNLDGKGATIRFTVTGGDGLERFALTTSSRKHPAKVRVAATAPHPLNASDSTIQFAEESLAEGDALWAEHNPKNAAEALAAYDRAIDAFRKLGDRAMLRRSLEWKAIYLAFTSGDAKAAEPLLEEAVAIPDAEDVAQRASAWKSLGFVQTTLADYPDAWSDYSKAIALFAQTGDEFNEEVLLENRGDLLRQTGDYDGAWSDAEGAIAIARSLKDEIGVYHIDGDIGELDAFRGQIQPAFHAYRQMLALEKIAPNDPMIGFAETDLAALYRHLGANAQAEDMLNRATAFWRAHPYRIGQLVTLNQRGKLESDSGYLLRADHTYRHGLNVARSAGMKSDEVFFLIGLGDVARERHDYTAAAADFANALSLAESLHEGDAVAGILTAQGDVAQGSGNAALAIEDYRRALKTAQSSFDHTDTIAALGGLAHAEFSMGNDAAANKDIEQALDTIESARDYISADSLRTAYFSSQVSYYSFAIRVLMRLSSQHPDEGYDRQALEVAERARARTLLDQLRNSGAAFNRGIDPAVAASREDTLRQLRLAEGSLAAYRADRKFSRRDQFLKTRVAQLLEKEDAIEATMERERAAAGDEAGAQQATLRSEAATIGELQHRLGANAAILEYWTNRDASYLWVVTSNAIQSFTLPPPVRIGDLVAELHSELMKPFTGVPDSATGFANELASSRMGFDETALRLGTELLPARALPNGVRTLIVIGDGPVLSIPFEALRIRSRTRGGTRSVFLQSRYAVVEEPSMGVLLALLQRPVRAQSTRIAVIADPVWSREDPRFRAASLAYRRGGDHVASGVSFSPREYSVRGLSESGRGADFDNDTPLPRLLFAGREAREIAALAGPRNVFLALGFSATRSSVESMNWKRYSIAHFATHAFFSSEYPQLDRVMLSTLNTQGDAQPGTLWFSNICSLTMPVQLVVLSACQTANGTDVPGEGIVGLSYAFFVAGARRVVGSLWNVNDAATAVLMRKFYAGMLKQGLSPVEALRRAQRQMAKSAQWSNPYYWAGFSIEGDWRPLPQ